MRKNFKSSHFKLLGYETRRYIKLHPNDTYN